MKIQVEFNPAPGAPYRLLGYENRLLRAEDFKDDAKDAGEVGAGHTVTALYEIVPALGRRPAGEPLRYQESKTFTPAAGKDELGWLKVRFKEPQGQRSRPMEWAIPDRRAAAEPASADFRFASAAALFGMLLRDSAHAGQAGLDDVLDLASGAVGKDPGGYRGEFLDLVEKARALRARDARPKRR